LGRDDRENFVPGDLPFDDASLSEIVLDDVLDSEPVEELKREADAAKVAVSRPLRAARLTIESVEKLLTATFLRLNTPSFTSSSPITTLFSFISRRGKM